jgi:hypothetical protein
MNKPNTANLTLLRTAARRAATAGLCEEAQGIYRRLLRLIESSYGKESEEYADCLIEAGRSMHSTLLNDVVNG